VGALSAFLPPLFVSPHVVIEPSALRAAKASTQSSIYPHRIHAVAGYAVDGNTDGEFLNSSTTHTQKEQGAWWQVDLGSKKSIDQIIIYNRIDCCANRL
jgi:hypothetical protein